MFAQKNLFSKAIIILTLLLLLASCKPTPIVTGDISYQPQPPIPVGAQATFSVAAAGKNLSFEWKATSGDFIGSTANASVVYKAPDAPQDVVTVSVTVKDDGGQQVIKNLTFKVVDITPPTETPAPPPTSMPTFTPEPTLTQTPSDTPTPADCWFNNLIVCSKPPIPVFVAGKASLSATFIDKKLVVDFNNSRDTSAVVLQFDPPLNMQGFSSLELVGASTQEFSFLMEYKAGDGNQLKIVKTSAEQSFIATSTTITITIPITYNGLINEIGFNFFKPGQSAQLTIESVRLRK